MTQLDVYNRALQRLGAAFMTTLAPNSEAALTVVNHFEFSKRDVLSRYHWNAATTEIELLADDLVPPILSFTYGFRVPVDNIALRYELDGNIYRKRGVYIYSDVATLSFAYVRNIQVDEMEDWLADLVAARLAADCTLRITGNAEYLMQNERLFATNLIQAKFIDSDESKEKDIGTTKWWTAEYD